MHYLTLRLKRFILTMEQSIHSPSAYAMLPLEPYSERLVEESVKLACGAAGVYFETADLRLFESSAEERLLEHAQTRIDRANIIIADVTSDAASLVYLTGYAYTRKKKVILVAFDRRYLPPDFRDRKVISYGGGMSYFRDKLLERIKQIIRPRFRSRRSVSSSAEPAEPADVLGRIIRIVEPNKVFISYSHRDGAWLERLKVMSAPLVWSRELELWDDKKIEPGSRWGLSIDSAIRRSSVAVILVSANFLASEFIMERELPRLLSAATEERLVLLWVLLSACLYEETEIPAYQAAHDISKPLDSLSVSKRNEVLRDICRRISEARRPAG